MLTERGLIGNARDTGHAEGRVEGKTIGLEKGRAEGEADVCV